MEFEPKGAGRRGEPDPSEAKRPDPGRPSHDAGEGTRGVARPRPEREERQPLPSVSDILERRAQLYEDWERLGHAPRTRPYRELRGQCEVQTRELRTEAASLYPGWSVRDQLMFDLYVVSGDWAIGLSPQETREFMARVTPLSVEELRKAKATAERKAAVAKKRFETRERQKGLPPEERKRLRNERVCAYYWANREKMLEAGRKWRERNRPLYGGRPGQRGEEPQSLQAEKPQPTQVFPPSANE
jgi:hypothetical protein